MAMKTIKTQVYELLRQGKEAEAIKLLEDLDDWTPVNVLLYADCLTRSALFDKAIAALEAHEDEDNPDWHYAISYAAFCEERWDLCILHGIAALDLGYRDLRLTFRDESGTEEQRFLIMNSYMEEHDLEGLRRFLEAYPYTEDPMWHSYYSNYYFLTGNVKKALTRLKASIRLFRKKEMYTEEESHAKILAQFYYDNDETEEYAKLKKKYSLRDSEFDISLYSLEEEAKVLQHIENYFGKIQARIQDFHPEFVNVDLLILAPSTSHPYITVMTLGMGARFMEATPKELLVDKVGRNELFLCLPDTWDFNGDGSWPLDYIVDLAKFPFRQKTWLGAGHSVGYEGGLGPTSFAGFMLSYPYFHGMPSFRLELSEEKVLHFYNLLPLYFEELRYKEEVGFDALEELFEESPIILDENRENVALKSQGMLGMEFFDEDLEDEEDFEEEEANILYQ